MIAKMKFKGPYTDRRGLGVLHLITLLHMGGSGQMNTGLPPVVGRWGSGPQRLELEPILPDDATDCEAGDYYAESEKAKTFRTARFMSQKLSG